MGTCVPIHELERSDQRGTGIAETVAGTGPERCENREALRKGPVDSLVLDDDHGLEAINRQKHLAKGGIDRKQLEELVEAGASIAKIAEILERSPGSVRHWLSAYGLETRSTAQRRIAKTAREAGRSTVQRHCQHHGVTDFWLEGRGAYRCLLCRQEAVVRRRRKIKQILVAEAGGACAICGYDRHLGGLHFHHRDPAVKSFALSVDGVARSLERARAEARKCILLCSNCHAEVEAGIRAIPA